jgi:hypothetical protein
MYSIQYGRPSPLSHYRNVILHLFPVFHVSKVKHVRYYTPKNYVVQAFPSSLFSPLPPVYFFAEGTMTTENFRISFLIFFGGSPYANIYLGHILHQWKFHYIAADEYSNICTYVYIG